MEATAVPVLDDMKAKGNRYSLASGGNHYKQFSLPEQGCDDGNKDGYCDNAYRFFREGVDARPSIRRWTSIDANNLGFPSSAFEVEIPSAVCTGCHFLNQDTEEEQAAIGPDIRSILGQPVAGEVGYAYSEALKGIGGVWTEQRLHRFLASPQAFSPGTTMVGVSIADHDLRQRIIDDLTTLAR